MKTIQQEFDEFITAIRLGHLEKDSIQYTEMRKSFFAGASLIYRFFSIDFADVDEKEGFKMLDTVFEEMNTFAQSLKDK